MNSPDTTGIGAHHAVRGVGRALRTQRNVRIEAGAAVAVVVLTLWLGADLVPILLCCALVLCCEIVNTATEELVDLISPAAQPAAGAAKDLAAGAVLVAAGTSVLVGMMVLGPPLWARIMGGS